MFNKQKDRYFPLPEYRIKKSTVSVEIHGEILSLDYADYLATHKDITLDEVIILDKAQKGNKLSAEEIAFLTEIGFSNGSVQQNSKSVQQSVQQNSKSVQQGRVNDSMTPKNTLQIKSLLDLKNLSDELATVEWLTSVNDIKTQVSGFNKTLFTILEYCQTPHNREDILGVINLINHSSNFKRHIQPLVDLGWIEKTNKINPKVKNQKYVLTEKGLSLVCPSL